MMQVIVTKYMLLGTTVLNALDKRSVIVTVRENFAFWKQLTEK